MALLLHTILVLVTLISATTSRFHDSDKRSTLTPALSLLPNSQGHSVVLLNSTLNVSALYTDCFEESEKHSLDPDQCMNALVNSEFASLPPNEILEFASRSSPPSPRLIGLPRRYLSSDGKCAIEPYLEPGALIAYNTPRGFNRAANRLSHDCVNDEIKGGGTIFGSDDKENLEIQIFEFEPHVQCYGSVNRQSMIPSCNNLANKMTASRFITAFVSGRSIPESFRLPYTEPDPSGGECRLTVTLDSRKGASIQHSSWYTFWEAVVAINAMCIRNGQRGRWLSIGYGIDHPGSIDVDVGSPQVEGNSISVATV